MPTDKPTESNQPSRLQKAAIRKNNDDYELLPISEHHHLPRHPFLGHG